MQTTSALALYGPSPGNVLSEHIKQFLHPPLLSLPLCKGSQLLQLNAQLSTPPVGSPASMSSMWVLPLQFSLPFAKLLGWAEHILLLLILAVTFSKRQHESLCMLSVLTVLLTTTETPL